MFEGGDAPGQLAPRRRRSGKSLALQIVPVTRDYARRPLVSAFASVSFGRALSSVGQAHRAGGHSSRCGGELIVHFIPTRTARVLVSGGPPGARFYVLC